MRQVNYRRSLLSPTQKHTGKSVYDAELRAHPDWEVDYIAAPPRMARYIEVSSKIYSIYLKYVAPEDMHVYSIDEVFIDATAYLDTYHMTAHDLAMTMVRDVLKQTGITATAGIGTNLYLCKVAMDIVAKKMPADKDGVRVAELDEMSYRRQLWDHEPLTDFWRVGRGVARRLALNGMRTMGDVARCSINAEAVLYKLFGKNAELLIDHAWGWEPCTIAHVKSYKPSTHSFSNGQVLHCPYAYDKALVVAKEMADAAALDLVGKQMCANQVCLLIGYDRESLDDPEVRHAYEGEVGYDYYGRPVPKHAQGGVNFPKPTSSSLQIINAVVAIYKKVVDPKLLIRRITVVLNDVVTEHEAGKVVNAPRQLDLFADNEAVARAEKEQKEAYEKERRIQEALLNIKNKFGKNAVLRGHSYVDGATAKDRNKQIGGHKA